MPTFKRTGFGSLQETETDGYSSATDLFENELVENSIAQRKNFVPDLQKQGKKYFWIKHLDATTHGQYGD